MDSSRPTVDAGRLWAGGAATALVAALIAVVGVLVARGIFDVSIALRAGGVGVGVALVILGVFQAFIVPIPEGSQAILLRRGRFYATLQPGNHVVPPWIIVSHLVTTRETPFAATASEFPTRDDVRK